jgi:hypothetical protein
VSLCRDLNASINIKNRGAHDLKAQLMSYGGVTQKPTPAFVGGVGMSPKGLENFSTSKQIVCYDDAILILNLPLNLEQL